MSIAKQRFYRRGTSRKDIYREKMTQNNGGVLEVTTLEKELSKVL